MLNVPFSPNSIWKTITLVLFVSYTDTFPEKKCFQLDHSVLQILRNVYQLIRFFLNTNQLDGLPFFLLFQNEVNTKKKTAFGVRCCDIGPRTTKRIRTRIHIEPRPTRLIVCTQLPSWLLYYLYLFYNLECMCDMFVASPYFKPLVITPTLHSPFSQ